MSLVSISGSGDLESFDWDEERGGEGDEASVAEEKDVADFLSDLYSGIYTEGLDTLAALQSALEAHPKQHYRCHFVSS